MRIFKFGGASVKDAEGVKNLGHIVLENLDSPMVIVVSAMGKTTNLLERLVQESFKGNEYRHDFDEFITFHDNICITLFGKVPEKVKNWCIQLEESLKVSHQKSLEEYADSIVSFGELVSTTIIHIYLQSLLDIAWVDARKLIRTNSIYGEANVDWQLTQHFIKRDLVPVLEERTIITQGFIGADFTGKTTTLGREGSDYTGAVFAYCLDAESLTVWKDVPGLLNADPKIFKQAEKFDELSFQEVTELTYYGAKVIHPKTLRPLAQKNIPLFVKSFIDPKASGTKVSSHEKVTNLPCFVFKDQQTLVTLRVIDTSLMDEKKLVKIFQALDYANIKVNLMHTSALTFSFCINHNEAKLAKLKEFIHDDFQMLYNDNLSLATIKNYTEESFAMLPQSMNVIMEQKTRNNYQVIYRTT